MLPQSRLFRRYNGSHTLFLRQMTFSGHFFRQATLSNSTLTKADRLGGMYRRQPLHSHWFLLRSSAQTTGSLGRMGWAVSLPQNCTSQLRPSLLLAQWYRARLPRLYAVHAHTLRSDSNHVSPRATNEVVRGDKHVETCYQARMNMFHLRGSKCSLVPLIYAR